MEITKDIRYIGVNDHDIDLFEGQYDVSENGMAYNSYVILGEKIAVADSVDGGFVDEWLGNLEAVLDGRTPDYLIVHHMEPDHSAGIAAFMERYPQAQIVASMGAFRMMVNYFGHRLPRAQDGRQRWRRARPGRPQPNLCRCPQCSLARGALLLRVHRQGAL